MLRRLLVPVAVLVALTSAIAARADDAARLDRLFELMRVQEVLRGFPEALMKGLDENPNSWSGDMSRDDVRALTDRHFAAPVLARDLRTLMAGKLSADEIEASIAFYESGFGRRIVRMEVAAAAPELSDTVEREGMRIYRGLVATDAPRVDQIRRMNQALSLVDWGMAMVMNMSYAMFTALYAGSETEGGLSQEQILAMINSGMGSLRTDLERIVNAETAYTYRDLDDEEFERYIAFLETPEGLALARASLDGMRTAMIERSRAFGDDLRVLMRQRGS